MKICYFCGRNIIFDDIRCSYCGTQAGYWTRQYENMLPVQVGSLIISKNDFEYKNRKHRYQDISHVEYDNLKRLTKFVSTELWQSETAKIIIYLRDGTVIKKTENSFFTLRGDLSHLLSNIFSVYKYFSEVSFIVRFNNYASMISDHGCFIYDDSKFFTDGHIKTRNGENIILSDWKIVNYGSFFQLTPRNPTILDKFRSGASNFSVNAEFWKKTFHGNLTFHTIRDKDVFYSLMLRIYGIKFQTDPFH